MSDRPISEKELEKIVELKVRRVLADLLGVDRTPNKKYLPTSKAWKELGYENADRLYEAVHSKLFRIGKEVQDRRRPNNKNARYYFDIEACLERLKESPERRSK